MTDNPIGDLTESGSARLRESLNAVFGEASPATIFSAPERVGDDLVVTAVAWERAGGFGLGAGSGADDEGGFGYGGGGASQGRPVAVVRIGQRGVEVRPVIDLTKIWVTVLLGATGVWRALRSGR